MNPNPSPQGLGPFDPHLTRLHRARAASRFRGDAFLTARVCDDLADRLEAVRRRFSRALVLGGGALGAHLAAHLVSNGKADAAYSADLSEAMSVDFACDPERAPFAEGAFDLIASPLLLHTCNDLPGAMIQIRRALKPDGFFLAAAFGGDTLQELRLSLLEAESELTGGASARVSAFGGVQDFAHLLQRAGFALPAADRDLVTVRYKEPLRLFDDLRAMGETSALRDRSKPLTRALLFRALEIYAQRFAEPDGRIRASFDILHFSGWSPAPSQQQPLKPGSAAMRLADALNVQERGLGEKAER